MADTARAHKIADRIKTLTAANLDSIIKDPDLGFVTVTDVRVTGDLQHASLFYTVFGDQAQRNRTASLLEAGIEPRREGGVPALRADPRVHLAHRSDDPGLDSLDRSLDHMSGGRKVGLSRTETNDRFACGLQGLGTGIDRKGR